MGPFRLFSTVKMPLTTRFCLTRKKSIINDEEGGGGEEEG